MMPIASYFVGAVIFFGSIVGLVVWIDTVLKFNRGKPRLNLAKRHITTFIAYETALLLCVVGYYFVYQPSGFNTGFLWANLLLYGRGALPAAVVTPIEDNSSDVAVAIVVSFVIHVIVDAALLYTSFLVPKFWRKLSSKKKSVAQ